MKNNNLTNRVNSEGLIENSNHSRLRTLRTYAVGIAIGVTVGYFAGEILGNCIGEYAAESPMCTVSYTDDGRQLGGVISSEMVKVLWIRLMEILGILTGLICGCIIPKITHKRK
jgi:hypothetical protein